MRNLQLLLAFFLAFVALSASAPDQPDQLKRALVARQSPTAGEGEPIQGNTKPTTTADSNDSKETNSDSKESGDSKSNDSKSSDSKSDSKETSKESATKSGDDSKETNSKQSGSSKKASSTRIPTTAQVGQITMKTPAPAAGYTIYKSGDVVTFEWNYTNIVVQPSGINVVAFCTDGYKDYTITENAKPGITKVEWDTNQYKSQGTQLPIATYTLMIWDSRGSRTDTPKIGYLAPYANLQFGVYTPQKYTDLNNFVCPTCDFSGANTLANKYAIRMMVLMGVLAATSFAWFAFNAVI